MAAARRRIRYAVVGLGHIAQVAVLPAFAHASRNSELVAVVSGDRTKRREMAKRYRLEHAFDYDDIDECLRVVDAVYIALPNSMHADYTIRAARAGVHVLCEKPMAVTVDECRRMITACRTADIKLMIAYRLHFETLNLGAIELARQGELGDLKFFNSSFSMVVRRGDIRTKQAVRRRNLVRHSASTASTPRVTCFAPSRRMCLRCQSTAGWPPCPRSTRRRRRRFVSENEQVATFVTSFHAADVAAYRIVGTRGDLHADPAYEYAEGLEYTLTREGRKTRKKSGKRDQFAPELVDFSDCILHNRKPEPSGEEGMQDVRIVQALYKSAKSGKTVKLPSVCGGLIPDDSPANHTARRAKAAAGEGAERKRRIAEPSVQFCRSQFRLTGCSSSDRRHV